MGNRVKGRVKKKSIKAASHSKMGSKRKLSRMGKKQKGNNAGLEATFIGRSKCLKLLQVTIKDFRRLCILKGIYPREPRGRIPGNKKGQTFYHIKDIKALAHEPLLESFREFRAFLKKIRRAAGRNEKDEAKRKNVVCPSYTLHHLVRERYPRFADALGDLDDALTLTFLFAALPSEHNIKAKVSNSAKSLASAWGAYCATAGCVTKSFISVKGIYMEASIQGVPIRWVIPHSFTQFMPNDVDYRVMTTFFEFYETLLNFVLFKLYNDLGVRYPLPKVEAGSEVKGSTSAILSSNLKSLRNALDSSSSAMTAIVSDSIKEGDDENTQSSSTAKKSKGEKKKQKKLLDSVDKALQDLPQESDDDDDDDDDEKMDVAGPLKDALENMSEEQAKTSLPSGDAELDDDAIKRRRLFHGLTFFLSREIPRGYVELISLAFGARVGWEGSDSPIAADDPSITHHIVDRPKLPSSYGKLPKSREFVQPQWIFDCSNFMFLLPVAKYNVGVTLPPHLSPWVDDEEEGYKPAYAEEIERLKNGETVDPATADDDDGDESIADEPAEAIDQPEQDDDEEDKDASEEEDSDSEPEKPISKKEKKKRAKEKEERKRQREEEEAHTLAKSMMSRKAAHLYGRMQHGLAKKKAKIDKLSSRREELEITKEKDALGRTPSKQKVDRLKKERKTIEDEYADTGGSMKRSKKRRSHG